MDQHIEQTLEALSGWRGLCREVDIAEQHEVEMRVALEQILTRLGWWHR